MVKFFKNVFGADKGDSLAPARPAGEVSVVDEPLELGKLSQLTQRFPLGEKIRYYPEYQKDSALDTLILGYGVNGFYAYSPLDVQCAADGIRIKVGDEKRRITELESFSLVIPYNPNDENKRDYMRRAELGPRGAFRRHNTITLVMAGDDGILAHLDTLVRKIMPIQDGIYAGHQAVILDVVPSSLTLTDQRQHTRISTRMPAILSLKDGGSYRCTLLDFAEESVQLHLSKTAEELDALNEWRRLSLKFDVGTGAEPKIFELEGNLYRKSGDRLVMKLSGIRKKGKSEELDLVDILDIKASLVRHPITLQAHNSQAEA